MLSYRIRDHGYTLVELLVVIAIIGVVAISLNLSQRSGVAEMLAFESERLARRLELAQARVRIAGGHIAFSAIEQGYTFWARYDHGPWREIDQDDGLRARKLHPSVRVSALSAAGIPIAWGERVAIVADDPVPLAISLQAAGVRAVVASDTFDARMRVHIEARR